MNDKSWFVVIDSKAVGPHSTTEIQSMLDDKKLSYADFVYRAGLTQWTPISEMQEFDRRSPEEVSLPDLPIPNTDENFEGWLLSTQGDGPSVQSGPYSKEQIQEKLENGEVHFTDLVWNKNLAAWKILGEVDEFNRREGSAKTDENGNGEEHVSRSHLRPEVSVKEGGSVEALAPSEKSEGKADKIAEPVQLKDQPAPIPKADPASEFDPPTASFRKKKVLIASVGAALGMLVVYLGLNAYRDAAGGESRSGGGDRSTANASASKNKHKGHSKVESKISEAEKSDKAEKEKADTTDKMEKTEKSDSDTPKAMQLKIVALKANTPTKPQLVFETNLPPESVIEVKIIGSYGKILNYPRLELEKKIKVAAGQMPTLDLTKEDLPYGDYKISARSEGLSSQIQLKVGVHDEILAKKLSRYRSELAIQEKKERQLLLSAVPTLNKLEQTLSRTYSKSVKTRSQDKTKKAWGEFYASWRKDAQSKFKEASWMEKQNPKAMIYPSAVAKYSQSKSKLMEISKALNTQLVSKRAVASSGVNEEEARLEFKKVMQDFEKDLRHLKK